MFEKSIFISLVIISVFFLSLCGFASPVHLTSAKPQDIVLQIVTDVNRGVYGPFEEEFMKKYPNVTEILWLEVSPSSELWISAVQSPSYSIDLLWGESPFNQFVDEEIISPIQNQTINDHILTIVPETFGKAPMYRVDDNGDILWVAAGISTVGIIVNHDNLALHDLPVPSTWEELASPDYYFGELNHAIGMGTSSTANRIYQTILQTFGWEAGWDIITRMAANSEIFSDSSDLRECTMYDQAVSISSDTWGYEIQSLDPSCEYILPIDESILNGVAIAVASGSEGEERYYAEKFIEFVLTPEAQRLWIDRSEQLPILDDGFVNETGGVSRPDMQTSWEKIKNNSGIAFDEILAKSINEFVVYYFQGAISEVMEEIYPAWEAIVLAYYNQEISEAEYRSLCRDMSLPGISFTEAKAITLEISTNSSIADTYVQQWKQAAIDRYQSISGKVESEKTDTNNDGSFFDDFAITITSPTNGSDVEDVVTITVSVVNYQDWSFLYGVRYVEFWVDDDLLANKSVADLTGGGLSTFSTEWNSTNYSTGFHTLTVIAKEYDGRSVQQLSIVNVNRVQVTSRSSSPGFEGLSVLLGFLVLVGYISIFSKRSR